MMRRIEVSAVELRRRLSTLLDTAWQEPLLVTRYRMPWVWVLSDATWQHHRQQLLASLEHHPLARVRELFDARLHHEHALLQRLLRSRRLGQAPDMLLRTLLLQVLYDFGSVGHLYDQVAHNRLFNWFVGIESEPPLHWTVEDLVAGLRELLEDEGVIDLIDDMLPRLPLQALAQTSGVSIEHERLQEWRQRYNP